MTNPDRLLTPDEVAAWLRERGFAMSANTVRKAITNAELPGRRIGSRYVTSAAQLERWFQGPEVMPVTVPTPIERFMRRRSA